MVDQETCQKPDRDEPRLVCGYPLPCPHHNLKMVILPLAENERLVLRVEKSHDDHFESK